jgi:SAM-dependent MidA family methyltransferase
MMELEPRRRPAEPFDPASVPSRPELVARIRSEIEAAGPIPFARFMALALYEPELGYYRSADARPGRSGDFLTAPEAHPIFGRALARQAVEIWERLGRPAPFTVREPGAGTGSLALGLLDGLERDRSPLLDAIRYEPVEIDARRLAAFASRLEDAGHGARIATATDAPIRGLVMANEVLDALPVHRVRVVDGELRERLVGWDGDAFAELDGPPSTQALAARLAAEGVELVEGQTAEIGLELDAWVARAAGWLEAGVLLVIDYGHEALELYGPRRRDGTLRAYLGHRVHADPYRHVGRQDLTAHVDLTALDRAAAAVGLAPLGAATQSAFLVGCGLEDLLEAVRSDPATTAEAWIELRAAVVRLIDPAAMGRFAVRAHGRAIAAEPALRGFTGR